MAEDPVLAAGVRAVGVSSPRPTRCGRRPRSTRACSPGSRRVPAARAADVRELGRRAARIADQLPPPAVLDGDTILVARELGPAEVAELDLGEGRIVAVALAEGSATSHAAIVARSLGVPMAVALGGELMEIGDGPAASERRQGLASIEPAQAELDEAREAMRAGGRRRRWARRASAGCRPRRRMVGGSRSCATRRRSPRSRRASRRSCRRRSPAHRDRLPAGDRLAHGAGASRCARAPARAARRPCRDRADTRLRGRQDAPFLERVAARGLELTLAHPDELAAQLRGGGCRRGTRLRLLLPLVETAQVSTSSVRCFAPCWASVPLVLLGAMIDADGRTPCEGGDRARVLRFFSRSARTISLRAHSRCGASCRSSAATAADPAVLAHVAAVVEGRTRSARRSRSAARGRYPGARGALRRSRRRRAQRRRRHASTGRGVVRALYRIRSSPGRRSGRLCRGRSSSCAQVRSGDELRRTLEGLATASAPEAEISSWVPPSPQGEHLEDALGIRATAVRLDADLETASAARARTHLRGERVQRDALRQPHEDGELRACGISRLGCPRSTLLRPRRWRR